MDSEIFGPITVHQSRRSASSDQDGHRGKLLDNGLHRELLVWRDRRALIEIGQAKAVPILDPSLADEQHGHPRLILAVPLGKEQVGAISQGLRKETGAINASSSKEFVQAVTNCLVTLTIAISSLLSICVRPLRRACVSLRGTPTTIEASAFVDTSAFSVLIQSTGEILQF
jgi:hypothetical protein